MYTIYGLLNEKDEVFYVGCSTNVRHRLECHKNEAKNKYGINLRKEEVIRNLLSSGIKLSYRVLEKFEDKLEALDFEQSCIAFDNYLTNLSQTEIS